MPVSVSVTVFVELLPSLTLPKFRLLALTDSVCVEATLLPLSAIVAGELAALLDRTRLPVTLPAVCGANCTLNELLCPADKVAGKESPVVLKPAPLMFAAVIVRLAFPVLLIWIG